MATPRPLRRLRRHFRRFALAFNTPGALILDAWCAKYDCFEIIASDLFWLYIILISTVFWMAAWFVGTTIFNIVPTAVWIYERACYACMRATSTSSNIAAADANRPARETSSPVLPLNKPLLSIDVRVHMSFFDAMKTIGIGIYLMLYGMVVAVAWICSALLAHPTLTMWIFIVASASTVCTVDAWQEMMRNFTAETQPMLCSHLVATTSAQLLQLCLEVPLPSQCTGC
jgi:hypothetical protein